MRQQQPRQIKLPRLFLCFAPVCVNTKPQSSVYRKTPGSIIRESTHFRRSRYLFSCRCPGFYVSCAFFGRIIFIAPGSTVISGSVIKIISPSTLTGIRFPAQIQKLRQRRKVTMSRIVSICSPRRYFPTSEINLSLLTVSTQTKSISPSSGSALGAAL